MIGTTISHYKILEKLGGGGMGVVYKAQDTALKRTVALKFLPPDLTSDPEAKKRFIHEAQAASALDHPNICNIHEVAETADGQTFIVMGCYDGQTLKKKIETARLEINEVVEIATQVAQGLQKAHEKGIVHRDIKPANIMITTDGIVKIVDFGLAKLSGRTLLTKSGSTLGTAAYMSPEQARGEQVDQRADIWSLGVVLYEMLTGHLPFRGEHEAAMMYSIMSEEPESLQKYLLDAPSELMHVLNRALEKDPKDRYQNVGEMAIDLRRLKKETSRVARPSDGSPSIMAKPSGRFSGVSAMSRWAIAGFLLLALAVVWWLIFRPSGHVTGFRQVGLDRSIAVVYFENHTADPLLDRILVDMLITNLGRNKALSVVSGQHLFDILKSLGKQDQGTIDQSTATEVARRAEVRHMLTGKIWMVGDKLQITAQLVDVQSGAVENSDRVEGSKPDEVADFANRLTERLHEWFGVSGGEVLKIGDATTNSYDAYKFYEMGMQQMYRLEMSSAAADFRKAISIDTTFASAYLMLSWRMAILEAGRTIPRPNLYLAREYLAKAKRYGERLPDKDRRFIDVIVAFAQGDFNTSHILVQRLTQDYPQEKDFLFFYSVTATSSGQYEEGIHAAEKAIELDHSCSFAYNQLAYLYCLQRSYEKAFWSIKTYLALLPDTFNPYDTGFDVYVTAGKIDEALKLIDDALKRWPNQYFWLGYQGTAHLLQWEPEKARERFRMLATLDPALAGSANVGISGSFLFEGKLNEAANTLRQEIQRRNLQNNKSGEMDIHLRLAKLYLEQNRFDEFEGELTQARVLSDQIYKGMFNPVPLVIDFYSGLCLLRKGDSKQAEARAAHIKEVSEKNNEPHYLMLYNGLTASIRLSGGRAQEALVYFEKVTPLLIRLSFPRFTSLHAAIYTQLGEKSKALKVCDDAQNFHIARELIGGDELEFFLEQTKLDYYRAQVHERLGDSAEAIKFYEKSISHWRNADKDYVNLVDAKNRLAKLKGLSKK